MMFCFAGLVKAPWCIMLILLTKLDWFALAFWFPIVVTIVHTR